jgi:hypothetical protein
MTAGKSNTVVTRKMITIGRDGALVLRYVVELQADGRIECWAEQAIGLIAGEPTVTVGGPDPEAERATLLAAVMAACRELAEAWSRHARS